MPLDLYDVSVSMLAAAMAAQRKGVTLMEYMRLALRAWEREMELKQQVGCVEGSAQRSERVTPERSAQERISSPPSEGAETAEEDQ